MTYLIEKDEGVANQRTLHFRVFLSNGTDPDTGVSNDSVIVARGSATTFTPDVLVTATHAAKGMYTIILTASNVSNLGPHAVYYTQGDFPQHIASFCVVNSNPYSNFSNIAVKTYSGVTFGIDNIKAATYSGVTVGVDTIKAATYSGVTVGIDNIKAATYSGVTIGGSSFVTINPGTYSNVTFSTGNIAPGTYSGVTVGVNNIAAGSYSGVTIGGSSFVTINPGTYSNVTFSAGGTAPSLVTLAPGTHSGATVGSAATILAGTYSGVTMGINNIASGTIQTADFAAAALDATVFATDAEQAFADRLLLRSIAGGADSGRTVGVALYALRNKVDMSSSIGTVYRVDDTTSAWTFSNTTGAFPISSVGP